MSSAFPVIDLFAGPGGLGEGFSSFNSGKSFGLALSIEKDPVAHSTLLLRSFFRKFKSGNIPDEYWAYARGEIDKTKLFEAYKKQARWAREEARCLELGKTSRQVVQSLIKARLKKKKKWVLVGGPPCQAYSLVGRSRMKNAVPDFEKDERHFLYREYLRILADHKPPVFLMENVKGMLSAKQSGRRIVEKILLDLKKPSRAFRNADSGLEYRLFSLSTRGGLIDFDPQDFVVRAEEYGIPQTRHRVLMLGIRSDIDITPEILAPASKVSISDVIGDLPRIRSAVSKEEDSYEQWRDILQSVQDENWYMHGKGNGLLKITDVIDAALKTIGRHSLDSGDEVLKYSGGPKTHKKWYRQDCANIIMEHSSRSHMRSDLHRYLFAAAYAAANGKSAHLMDFPKELLPAHKNIETKSDFFTDRFRVQTDSKPSTTITSHISKDGHYFIHYDPSQCRSLTVREAARLQTFPDNYKFEGNRTAQYHQVGNAVPPLLAQQIAEIVHDILKRVKI